MAGGRARGPVDARWGRCDRGPEPPPSGGTGHTLRASEAPASGTAAPLGREPNALRSRYLPSRSEQSSGPVVEPHRVLLGGVGQNFRHTNPACG